MGKTLLVLGASSDIAMEYIREYHSRYDTIAAHYFSHRELLEALEQEVGRTFTLCQADLSHPDSVRDLILFLKENEIEPDYILHCPAGRTGMTRPDEFESDALRRELQVEVFSILEIVKAVVPHMQEQEFGRICFILSSVTVSPVSFQSTYIVAKHALLGAMRSLAADLAGKKITVNAVSPSRADTKYNEGVSPFVLKQAVSGSPLKRLAAPSDISGAIALFLSDENTYITGENLLISGGGIIR